LVDDPWEWPGTTPDLHAESHAPAEEPLEPPPDDPMLSEELERGRLGALSRRAFLGMSVGALPVVGLAAAGLRAVRLEAATAPPHLGATGAAGIHRMPLHLQLNGRERRLEIDTRSSLLDALREDLGLMVTKKGCDHGQCGACTVLVDGRRVLSCLTLAATVAGHQVTTVEGLAQEGDHLHPVQAAFLKHDAFQCGYCTPGQIVSAVGLLAEGCPADAAHVRECMSGNLCRCGAYPNIVAAVLEARGAVGARGTAGDHAA